MRKKTFTAFIALALVYFIGCGQTPLDTAKNLSSTSGKITFKNAILEGDVSEALRYLSSDELQGRATGTEGIEMAAKYIEQVFQTHNIKPFFKTYRDSFQVQGVTGYNLIGLVEGSDPKLKEEYIIIGAHYDHVGQMKAINDDSIANGANDNASGTIAVLELAKFFAQSQPKRSMLFTLFSAEEMGLVGAGKLAKRLKNEKIDLYTMFNIEMIGVPMAEKSYKAYVTGYDMTNLAEVFNKYSGKKVLGLLPEAKMYSLFKRSDNYAFYKEFNIPAQTISTFDFKNYAYYHHVDDEFQNLDVSHMTELIKSIIPGTAKMADTSQKEIKLNK